MKVRSMCFAIVAAGLIAAATARPVEAQVVVAPAPTISYYVPPAPVVSYYYAPAAPVVATPTPVVAAPAPVVSYYTSPAPVTYYYTSPGVISYYTAPSVVYPARVSRGLFGRTIVRTPYGKYKY